MHQINGFGSLHQFGAATQDQQLYSPLPFLEVGGGGTLVLWLETLQTFDQNLIRLSGDKKAKRLKHIRAVLHSYNV